MLEFYLLLVLILGSEMKRYLIVLIFLLYIGCEDESSCDVELWGECYSIADTDSLNLSLQQLTGPIPPDIGKLTNLTQEEGLDYLTDQINQIEFRDESTDRAHSTRDWQSIQYDSFAAMVKSTYGGDPY